MSVEDLALRFKSVPMTDERKMQSKKIRDDMSSLADVIDIYCPESREKSLALTKLQESLFWIDECLAKR